ncbi:MAG TPA: hypothetical protein VF815_40585 [Myxococcaceae bacterium]|jgi:hypothetical protein
MRWFQAAVGSLLVLALAGCPSEFGKGGRVSKAVGKDAAELAKPECSEEELEKFCGKGKELSPECQACFD